MASWNEIMSRAVSAKKAMATDRTTAEAAFDGLAREFPTSGMVYYQQGQGYEAAGEKSLAFACYTIAEGLFEVEEWRKRATTCRIRCSDLPPGAA